MFTRARACVRTRPTHALHLRPSLYQAHVSRRITQARFKLVPRVVDEERFWRNYFYRVSVIRVRASSAAVAQAEHTNAAAPTLCCVLVSRSSHRCTCCFRHCRTHIECPTRLGYQGATARHPCRQEPQVLRWRLTLDQPVQRHRHRRHRRHRRRRRRQQLVVTAQRPQAVLMSATRL
jgi:hypothetical protein